MDPSHDSIAVTSATETKGLSPDAALVLLELLLFTLLGLTATLGELPFARRPALFAALVDEFGTVLLEDGHGEQAELVILGQFLRRARDDHRAQ